MSVCSLALQNKALELNKNEVEVCFRGFAANTKGIE